MVLLAPVVLVACGGDDTADIDPAQVLTETLSNDETVTSGTIDIGFDGSVEGNFGLAGEGSGGLDVSLTGPFQANADDPTALPQVDLTGSFTRESSEEDGNVSVEGGLTITEDNAYVTYQDTPYELGAEFFGQFQTLAETAIAQAASGATGAEGSTTETPSHSDQCVVLLEQAGGNAAACDTVDVFSWFDLTNEGTEEIEGAETIHVHGVVDTAATIENINATIAAAEIPGTTEIPDEVATQIGDAVTDLSFDVYSGVDDRLLRGFDLNLDLDASALPAEEAADATFAASLSTRLGAVNEPQTIEAPADAQPLDDLLSQFGLDSSVIDAALSGYATQFGLGGVGATGVGGVPEVSGGGTPGDGVSGSVDAYSDCIINAPTDADIKKCEDLLP